MLDHLSPGEHICHLYETDEERRLVAMDFIKQGLAQSQSIVILNSDYSEEIYPSNARPAEPQSEVIFEDNDIIIFSRKMGGEPGEEVDVDQFTDWLTTAAEITAQRQNERADTCCIRVLTQMDCILPTSPTLGQIDTYERFVHQYFNANNCIVLCQYDRLHFPARLLNETLVSHPLLIIGKEMVRNFYYIAVQDKSEEDLAQTRFNQWTNNLIMTRKAEEELYLTRAWVEGASDIVLWANEASQIVYANSTACDQLGYTHDKLLTMTVEDIEPTFTLKRWAEKWPIFKEMGSSSYETELVTRKGQVIPVEVKRNFLAYNEHEYCCTLAHDISEHKQREKLQLAIYQISEAAMSARSQQELFETVHSLVASLIPAKNLFIALYDAPSGMISFPYFVDEYDICPPPRKNGKGLTRVPDQNRARTFLFTRKRI